MQSAQVDGKKLRAVREDRELTGGSLASLLSSELGRRVHFTTVYKIEAGSRQPSAKLFGAICRTLRCEKADLLVAPDLESSA